MTQPLAARTLMEKLVSFPTVSRDSNLPLIDWVEEYLDTQGISCHRHYSPDRNKAALFAHAGPNAADGVVLSGHTDVVPVDGQPWNTDPFTVTEKDGQIYGRGTCDMKGFDALAIWALVEAHHRGVKRPLQLALSYDEEVGCIGAPLMIDRMLQVLPKASVVIVGEPSMMQAVTGHKGAKGFHTHVVGFEVHSSLMHTGVNAIMSGAKLIEWASEMNQQNRAKPVDAIDAAFYPPWTTVHVGMIEGGTAHNITAKDCRFGVDFRCVPSESLAGWEELYRAKVREVEAEMQAVHPEARIKIKERFSVPALRGETAGEAERIARQLTGDNANHVVSYGTEAGQFQERGYSAVICGPGDIAQAHQPNEYITAQQFSVGEAFMARLLDSL